MGPQQHLDRRNTSRRKIWQLSFLRGSFFRGRLAQLLVGSSLIEAMDEADGVPGAARQLKLDGRVPIVVGVSGHRHLVDADRADQEEQVRKLLLTLLDKYPNTPVVMLSALAEGADQLAADVLTRLAAQNPSYEKRLHLVVPLPMEVDAYKQGFWPDDPAKREQAQREFDRLAANALCYEVQRQDCRWSAGPYRDDDNEGFRELAAYLVRNSHIVLALVEPGEEVSDPPDGGTMTVVDWARKGLPGHYKRHPSPLQERELSFVVEIPVRRRATAGEFVLGAGSSPDFKLSKELSSILQRFDEFNQEDRRRLKNRALISSHHVTTHGGARQEQLGQLGRVYGHADAFSRSHQRRTVLSAWSMLVLTFLAAFAFESFAHFHLGGDTQADRVWTLAVYVGLLFVVFGWYLRFSRKRVNDRYLDYRALAEALRLQAAWKYAGVREVVSDHYARYYGGEVAWVRHAVRGLFACLPPFPDQTPEAICKRMEEVRESWVRNQRGWLKEQHRKLDSYHRAITRARRLLIGIAMATAIWIIYYLLGPGAGVAHVHGADIALGVIVVCLALAALLHGLTVFRAHRTLARRYGSQHEIFARADKALDGPRLPVEDALRHREAVLCDLGKEVLVENCSWLITHRDRPLEPHWH